MANALFLPPARFSSGAWQHTPQEYPDMNLQQAVALSISDDLSRKDLTARLLAGDPRLLEQADRRLAPALEALAQATERGVIPLAWNDARFPGALLTLSDCPPVLWCKGQVESLTRPAVAIVGSRSASAVALETAARLAADVAACGATIVSGLARGVDSAAHRGALRTGCTVAVLGGGLDRIYPPEHVGLAGAIAAGGCVVSEYPLTSPPVPFHFPQRNRLISGLSRIVVVIEASEKSGSLITAACALEQGREVMAVPGNVLSGRNRGGHALIRDGAKIVESADDIVGELRMLPSWPGHRQSELVEAMSPACDPHSPSWMEQGRAYELDELSRASGLAASSLLPRLSEWELRGVVRRLACGRFIRASGTC
jgi:DNA processing protein